GRDLGGRRGGATARLPRPEGRLVAVRAAQEVPPHPRAAVPPDAAAAARLGGGRTAAGPAPRPSPEGTGRQAEGAGADAGGGRPAPGLRQAERVAAAPVGRTGHGVRHTRPPP